MKYLQYLLLVTLLVSVSCSEDDLQLPGQFETGVFVINEGNFGVGNGSLSYIDSDGTIAQQVFSSANGGLDLGDVPQSMHVPDADLVGSDFVDQGFIVVNNSNTVEVVNMKTLEREYTISDVASPRYITSYAGRAYITEWVGFGQLGRVSELWLASGTVTHQHEVGELPEQLLVHRDQLYVSNNGSGTVSIFDRLAFSPETEDQATLSLAKTIEVGDAPGALMVIGDDVWVVCAGGFDEGFNPLGNGSLVRINRDNQVDQTVSLDMNISSKAARNDDGSRIYFYAGDHIHYLSTAQQQVSSLTTVDGALFPYGIGFNDGEIWLADAQTFVSSSLIRVFDESGVEVATYSGDIGSNGFLFRN